MVLNHLAALQPVALLLAVAAHRLHLRAHVPVHPLDELVVLLERGELRLPPRALLVPRRRLRRLRELLGFALGRELLLERLELLEEVLPLGLRLGDEVAQLAREEDVVGDAVERRLAGGEVAVAVEAGHLCG